MRRREFFGLLSGAAVWPFAARAQPSERMRRIGVLLTYAEGDAEGQARFTAFKANLKKLGWVEGRNIRIDLRWATIDRTLIQRFAKELVASQPDLIVAQNTPTTAAILQHTRTVPIVFFQASDPVGSGFIASLPRPGGNVTGFIDLEASLAGKWVELLYEMAPRVGKIALLFNPTTATYFEYYLSRLKVAASSLGIAAVAAPVRDKSEIASVLGTLAGEPASGLAVMPEASMGFHRIEIVSQAARHKLPAIYPYAYYVRLGGLLSYGIDLIDQYGRAAAYVDRILRGEQPAILPVQQPAKFELAVNAKAAKALGLTVPPSLLARADADEVIE
jgi:putative ABC transport system substrate-binding protein